MRQSYCKACSALIWWGTTKNGRPIPLEEYGWAVPNKGGETMWDEYGNQFHGIPCGTHIPGAIKYFRPHFLDCPAAAVLRKPKARKKTEYERLMDEKTAAKAAKQAEAAARKAEKAAAEKAQAEFEARQIKLF